MSVRFSCYNRRSSVELQRYFSAAFGQQRSLERYSPLAYAVFRATEIYEMPNCDFYATIEDHKLILDHLFKENECEIYELYSEYGKPLKQFSSSEGVLAEFNNTYENGKEWTSVYLQLYVLGAGFKFETRKVSLNPKKCNGHSYRYTADHVGLIQLYLDRQTANGLANSHTNHSSEKRAVRYASTPKEIAELDSIDFNKIKAFSSKLNRRIKKESVAKIASRHIMPGALAIWNSGVPLDPYTSENSVVEYT